jgi:hypothetical protein
MSASYEFLRCYGGVHELATESLGTCYLCGDHSQRTGSVAKWMGANFVDQARARYPASQRVCEACMVVTSRSTHAGEGRPENHHIRMYSHALWRDGMFTVHETAHRGEAARVRRWLLGMSQPRWLALSVTGKKHVLPFAELSEGGSLRVMLESTLVTTDQSTLEGIVSVVHQLQANGQSAAAIASGEPYVKTRDQLAIVRPLFARLDEHRGAPVLDLALFLARQKAETDSEA